ncbi:Protein patched 1 [Nymphon striatum]|nr:Protein patched 1 [Nymphon striatum]
MSKLVLKSPEKGYPKGGRLEKELKYIKTTLGEGSGSTNQMLIQTPKLKGSNLLHPDALLAHFEAIQVASQVSIEMFDIRWKLKDLCYTPSFPSYDAHYIDIILENLFPCAIITPLDCFWEGSKLLGPEHPVLVPGVEASVQWSNLNPSKLIQMMREMGTFNFNFDRIEDFMKQAGITSAFQEKPCLNPFDPECPTSAPNKNSTKPIMKINYTFLFQPLDIGSEVTGGCYGFAPKYMHWPEELIIGGSVKNKTGHIVRAEALQTIIQLMGEKDMYDFWADHYKVHNIDWTPQKSRQILEAWQREFKHKMLNMKNSNATKSNNLNAFTTTSLRDILKEFSQTNATRIAVGYILMLIYAFSSLLDVKDYSKSLAAVGLFGVLLIAISVAAGLGFCSLSGILFNASTTQIVPFLALGLGVDDMFLLVHTHAENMKSNIPKDKMIGECLKRAGVSVLITSVINAVVYFTGSSIPIPALKAFTLQIAILVLFNCTCIFIVFPAILSLDLKSKSAKFLDVFCCISSGTRDLIRSSLDNNRNSKVKKFKSSQVPLSELPKHTCITHALPPDRNHIVTVLAEDKKPVPPPSPSAPRKECWSIEERLKYATGASIESLASVPNSASTNDLLKVQKNKTSILKHFSNTFNSYTSWKLSECVENTIIPALQSNKIKIGIMLMFVATLAISIYGMLQVTDGLDLTDIVPIQTNEYKFLSAQSDYFGFYNMYAVTKGNFEYPTNQKLLYEYHESFVRVNRIIKNDDGGLPEFWLAMMRDWLLELQKAFDDDWKKSAITTERWFANASNQGILAYKLLVQTGHVDNPIDKSLVNSVRLVNEEEEINPKAFYNYLTAWATNDALAYSASQANLIPEPRQWFHVPQDVDLKIPKSQPLIYTQMPFYLNKLGKTSEVTSMIKQVREVCDKFEALGLPNFPTGIPFTFWEQYIGLRFYLGIALAISLVAVFVVVTVVLLNPWAAIIYVFILASMLVQLFGFMGFIEIKLSAVPAVILVVSVGMSVEFTFHVMFSFITSIGDRNRRMGIAVKHTFIPVLHGAVTTFLGIFMLCFTEFDFIKKYFLYVLLALVAIGVFNGLFVLPVILSLIGPSGEVIPRGDPNKLQPPTPEPSPVPERRYSKSKNVHLSTITEEASSQSSREIIVHPEVVVETTTSPHNVAHNICDNSQQYSENNRSSGNQPSPSLSTSSSSINSQDTNNSQAVQHSVTTKVTATVKVEVHTPLPGAVEREQSLKRKRRKAPRDPPPYTP